MQAAYRLPDVHPGAPGTARISFEVLVIRNTLNAMLVTAPTEEPGKTVWLPRSQAWELCPTGHIMRHDKPAGGARIRFDKVKLNLPVWLYRKVRLSLS